MTPNDLIDLADARRAALDGSARAIRLSAGLSETEVGGAAGVAGPTISRWERGLRQPRGLAAVRWIRLLRRLERSKVGQEDGEPSARLA